MKKCCHKCHTAWEGIGQPGTKETCVKCGSDLHACLNCRFYDTGKPYQCLNDVDPVRDKERWNYCEEFQFSEKKSHETASKNETTAARDTWNKLFRKS